MVFALVLTSIAFAQHGILDDPARPAEERERDSGSKPLEVYAFFGVDDASTSRAARSPAARSGVATTRISFRSSLVTEASSMPAPTVVAAWPSGQPRPAGVTSP